MDPTVALDKAKRFMLARDYVTAWDYLQDYWDWRDAGGYEPHRGDKRAECIGESCHYTRVQYDAHGRVIHATT